MVIAAGQIRRIKECAMKQSIAHVALVVRDYDEAIDFYTGDYFYDTTHPLLPDTPEEMDRLWRIYWHPPKAS